LSASTEASAPTVQFVLLSLALAGGLTYALLRLLIRFLKQKQWVVMDYHKKERPMVPKPGGPAILAGFLVGEAALYFYFQAPGLLALMATTGIAGAIGLLDDIVTLGGIVKPASLILASLPILLLGTYDFNLRFPFFGTVFLPIIYPLLILIAIPVVSNTVNTIDVLNGVVSGFMVIASLPILILLLLAGNTVMAAATGVFTVVAAAFYLVHRYPSKIFPGDSGSLSLGAAYGALVIIGRAEMMGVIALIPAILNSFFVISSVKGLPRVLARMATCPPLGVPMRPSLSSGS